MEGLTPDEVWLINTIWYYLKPDVHNVIFLNYFVKGILVIAFCQEPRFLLLPAVVSMKMFSFNRLFSVSVFVNFVGRTLCWSVEQNYLIMFSKPWKFNYSFDNYSVCYRKSSLPVVKTWNLVYMILCTRWLQTPLLNECWSINVRSLLHFGCKIQHKAHKYNK